jgi:putative ABC transport system ATP-binding protein
MAIFRQMNKENGNTIVVITHDPEIAERVERIIWIRDGLIVNGAL